MRSPYIGKVFAVLVIVIFLGWSAVRSIGAKPAEPKFPFPKPTTDEPLAAAKGPGKSRPRRRMLLGRRSRLRSHEGCHQRRLRIFRWTRRTSRLRNGEHRPDRSRRIRRSHLRSVADFLRPDFDDLFLGRARPDAAQSPGSRRRLAISFRDLLHDRRSKAHRHRLRRTDQRRENVSVKNRDADRAVQRLLSRRGISPALPRVAHEPALHRLQRPARNSRT